MASIQSIAPVISRFLPLILISSSFLCRELLVEADSAAQNPSKLVAAEWRYDRSSHPSERYGEHYTRRRWQEPEEEERYFGSEEGHYGGYPRRPYHEPERRRYREEEEDRTYYHGGQQEEHYRKPREDRERYAEHGYEPEASRHEHGRPEKKGYDGKEYDEDFKRWGTETGHDWYRHDHERERFVLDERSFVQQTVMDTEAGEMSVILPRDAENEFARRMIALSFLILEPKALLLPHYTNTNFLFVVFKGKVRISWVNGENLQELDLEEGDVYKIESGTLFYLLNTEDRQRMNIFGIHDVDPGSVITKRLQFHSFFVAGGGNLGSVLSRFDDDVLATSFNVSGDTVYDVLSSELGKPIIYQIERNESKQEHPSKQKKGEPSDSKSERQQSAETSNRLSLEHVANMLLEETGLPHIFEDAKEELEQARLSRVFENFKKKDTPQKPLNILKKKPIYSNDYGTTTVADENDFEVLKDVNKGVFSARLKPGAILAPHWNPRAMEVALVTEGEGEIQIVYPNGRESFTGLLTKGSIFYVPQNFAMCQIASRDRGLELLGFSTSSRPNNPQFLAGPNSVLKKLGPSLLASSFNIPVEYMQKFLDKQHEAVILPGNPELTA